MYAFEKDYYLTKVIPEIIKNSAFIPVPLERKKNTTLNILSGTDMIIQFLVK